MKAIQVKILPATNTKGTRLKAIIKDGLGSIASVTEARNYEGDISTQAQEVAKKLINKMKWNVEISGSGVFAEDYYFTLN